ncbi:Rv3654c family TadE-like protein [Polymorphospora lycopeni]|uniref:Rv3654c family TadE-like protein n=1 Tax=Polymorphospora lycopeni TaxID=3140240 RepID=A0ABV5D2Q9_9ACTN
MTAAGPPTYAAPSDRGSASLWVLAVGLLLVAAGIAGAAVGAARVAGRQAKVAADLGALAGAARTLDGAGPACARAAMIVEANGARLVSCTPDGLDLLVTADVVVHPMPGLARTARATTRAGPVRAGPGGPP